VNDETKRFADLPNVQAQHQFEHLETDTITTRQKYGLTIVMEVTKMKSHTQTSPNVNVIQTLTRLANEKAHIVSEYRSVTIKKVARQIHHYRKLSQFFQQLTCLRIFPTTATGNQQNVNDMKEIPPQYYP
jgi:hypothetical protein